MPSIAFSLNNDLSKQPAGNNWGSLIGGGLVAAAEEGAEYATGQGIKSMFSYRKDSVRVKGTPRSTKGFYSPQKIGGKVYDSPHLVKGRTVVNKGKFTGKAGKFKAKLGQEYGFFAQEYQYMHGTKAYNELMERTAGKDNFNPFGRSKTGKLLNKAFRETSENYLISQSNNVLGKGVAKNMRNVATFMKQKSYQKAAQTVGGKFWQKGIGKGIAKTGKVAGKVGGFALKGADLITGKAFSKIATELNLDVASTAWAAKNSGMFGKTVSANMGKIAGGALLTGVQNALGAFQAASMIDLGIFATKLFTDSFAARGARIKEERDALEGLRKYGQMTSYQYQDSQAAKAMREQAVQNIMMLKNTPNEARMRSTNPYEFYRLIGG